MSQGFFYLLVSRQIHFPAARESSSFAGFGVVEGDKGQKRTSGKNVVATEMH